MDTIGSFMNSIPIRLKFEYAFVLRSTSRIYMITLVWLVEGGDNRNWRLKTKALKIIGSAFMVTCMVSIINVIKFQFFCKVDLNSLCVTGGRRTVTVIMGMMDFFIVDKEKGRHLGQPIQSMIQLVVVSTMLHKNFSSRKRTQFSLLLDQKWIHV